MVTQFDEKGKFYTNVISKKPRLVTIQTATHRIRGTMYVRPDERLIDELNLEPLFLAVTDAQVIDLANNTTIQISFMTVNTHQIIWLAPDEEGQEGKNG
jgi:hypothetical protein